MGNIRKSVIITLGLVIKTNNAKKGAVKGMNSVHKECLKVQPSQYVVLYFAHFCYCPTCRMKQIRTYNHQLINLTQNVSHSYKYKSFIAILQNNTTKLYSLLTVYLV